jgi:RNA polymerase sigma factor (sigma-70 family)
MPSGSLGAVLRYLRRLAVPGPVGDRTDGQLLERFVSRRDEDAFAALVQRHGPLVWGVCRRVLGHADDAADAFQATFLVLVRKAGSVVKRDSVRSWLYGVAHRVAVRARVSSRQRRLRERQAPAATGAGPEPEVWEDLRVVLDEEVQRLPPRYRTPFILCYLEGKTGEEAGRLLGCPRATVATRLARARERLRGRLSRRGLALPAGVLAAVLTQKAAAAEAPAALLSATVQAALLAARQGSALAGVSPQVATLTQGVLEAMFLTRLKITLAVVLAAAVFASGAGVLALRLRGAEPPAPKNQDPPAPAAKAADRQRELTQALAEAAKEQYEARWKEYLAGRTASDFLLPWSAHWLNAQLALSETKADRLAAYQAHFERMKAVEEVAKAKFDAGSIAVTQYTQTRYHRLEAELWLEKAKAR